MVVDFENGDRFHVDADIIARSRANYYGTEVDGHKKGSPGWTEEYEYSLGDDSELIDWCSNNMNWKDLKDHAVKVDQDEVEPDYEDMWGSADREIDRG